jgi:hypothetical protein
MIEERDGSQEVGLGKPCAPRSSDAHYDLSELEGFYTKVSTESIVIMLGLMYQECRQLFEGVELLLRW